MNMNGPLVVGMVLGATAIIVLVLRWYADEKARYDIEQHTAQREPQNVKIIERARLYDQDRERW